MLASLRVTPTSSDPLIAALFAVNCRRFGNAVFLACHYNTVLPYVGSSNCLSELEKEFVIDVAPLEFAERFAEWVLDSVHPCGILTEMGFEVPEFIGDRRSLKNWIFSSPRLTSEQIAEFNRRVLLELEV